MTKDELKKKYCYCDCVEIELLPSISPAIFNAHYSVKCGLYNFTIDTPEDCANCRLRKDK